MWYLRLLNTERPLCLMKTEPSVRDRTNGENGIIRPLMKILMVAMVMVPWMACATAAATDVYARETDAFLAARDGRVQAAQIAAIRRATAGEADDLKAVRTARNTWASLPDGVEAEMLSPTMRLYRPKGGRDLPLLIYLHGGGWVIGSLASCSAFCGAVAAKGCAVLALDYPLAPEHPFPAALNAVCAAFRAAVSDSAHFGADPARVSIGGDSSGGNLALAAAIVLQKENLKPRSLVLYYPVTEARADGSASWRTFAAGCGMDAAFMDACLVAYLNGHDPADPLVSPAFASDERLRRLPSVHILGADRDVLRDQGLRFARRLKALGIPVRASSSPSRASPPLSRAPSPSRPRR